MEDHLRPNEFDGIGNMCEIRAIGFAEFVGDEYVLDDSNPKEKKWTPAFNSQGKQKTSKELYKEYLNTLTTTQP